MSEELLIRSAAPTLAGLKAGSLFPCRFGSRAQLTDELRQINRRLGGKGLRLLPLRIREDSALLYLYRPRLLQRDLENSEARRLLAEVGYDDLRPGRCLPQLLRRFRSGTDFPHEIGLFLSYPPEDVRGFIRHKGRNCKCVGCWKVYGDAEEARRRFESYRRCTDRCCRRYAMGASMDELLAEGE
jgi:hypothetical protein